MSEQKTAAIKAELEAIARNPPWEFYGVYDEQRCFFCGEDKSGEDGSDTPHRENCLYRIVTESGVPDLVSPGDLRARIEQLEQTNSGDERASNDWRDGYQTALDDVLALLGAAQEKS